MLQYLRKVLYILSGSRRQLYIVLLAFMFTSLLEALGIGLIGPFLQVLTNPKIVRDLSVLDALFADLPPISDAEIVIFLGTLVIALFCLKAVAYGFSKYYIYRFSFHEKSRLESRLVSTYLRISYEFHLNHNSAELIKNIIVESQQFATNCLIPLLEITANIIVVAFLLIILAYTDLSLLVVALAVLFPTVLLFTYLGRWMRTWGEERSKSMQNMICAINHSLGGLKETKVIGCEAYFEQELQKHSQRYARAAIFADIVNLLPRVSIETVLVIFLLAFIMGAQLISGRSLEDLTSVMGVFAVASIRLLPATSQMLNALGRMRESSYALDMLYHDLKEIESHGFRDRLIRRQPLQPISKPVVFHNEIRLQKISYRYPNASSLAINNLSLTLRKGESIAFVGKSGSGKTTLADLLLGLLMPASGDIQVDGRSIYQDLRSWQDLVGYIPQSIFLTDDTIENNIAFGVPAERIDSSRLQAAIQSAQLTDLIDHLPEGVHTRVGERGVRLSGGQRQRIGIARALYHGREVLILDEATSALDTETERQIDDAISSLAGSKTLIIIAHRVSTIEKCDRIYRIEAGTVKQSGTYAEIILSQ